MFYIVNGTGRIVASASGAVNVDDLAARGERVIWSEHDLPLAQVEVVGFPTAPVIVEKRSLASSADARITLTTTAEDTDGDGVPDLPADGRSKASITALVRDRDGQPVEKSIDVHFRTSAGSLARRKVTTEAGEATVQLTAGRETVPATIYVFAEGIAPARLSVEFVPPED